MRAEIRGLGLKMAKIIKLDLSSGDKKPAENKITGEKLSSFFPGPSEILFYRYVMAILQIRHIFEGDKYLDFSKKIHFFSAKKIEDHLPAAGDAKLNVLRPQTKPEDKHQVFCTQT